MKTENRRKRYRPAFRYYETRILAFVVGYMILLVLFMAVFIFIPNFIQMTDPKLPFDVQAAAARKILEGHSGVWPALLALVVLVGIHFYRVFNRFIGPVYRFSDVFKKISDGDLSGPLHLRKNDFLQEEKDEINRMLEVLSDRIGNAQQDINQATGIINYIKQTEADVEYGGQDKSMADRLNELSDLNKRLDENLGFFQINNENET